MTVDKFFVYGTLKVGGHYASSFDGMRKTTEIATLRGYSLYDLGPFPAIVKDEGGVVYGEIHEYSDTKEATERMDEIEGFNGNVKDRDNLYIRKIVDVVTSAGKEVKTNTYIFNRVLLGVKAAEKIENGIWELN